MRSLAVLALLVTVSFCALAQLQTTGHWQPGNYAGLLSSNGFLLAQRDFSDWSLFNIQQPANPQHLFDQRFERLDLETAVFRDPYLYFHAEGSIHVYRRDDEQFSLQTQIEGVDTYRLITAGGGLAYRQDGALHYLDLSDPAAPVDRVWLASFNTSRFHMDGLTLAAVQGEQVVFYAQQTEGDLAEQSRFSHGMNDPEVALSGTHLYLIGLDGALRVYQFQNGQVGNLLDEQQIENTIYPRQILAAGTRLVVRTQLIFDTVSERLFDFSQDPVEVSSQTTGLGSVALENDLLLRGDVDLEIFQWAASGSLALVHRLRGMDRVEDVMALDGRFFVAADRLYEFDFGLQQTPLATIDLDQPILALDGHDQRLFALTKAGEVAVLDIADFREIDRIGGLESCRAGYGGASISYLDEQLFVHCEDRFFHFNLENGLELLEERPLYPAPVTALKATESGFLYMTPVTLNLSRGFESPGLCGSEILTTSYNHIGGLEDFVLSGDLLLAMDSVEETTLFSKGEDQSYQPLVGLYPYGVSAVAMQPGSAVLGVNGGSLLWVDLEDPEHPQIPFEPTPVLPEAETVQGVSRVAMSGTRLVGIAGERTVFGMTLSEASVQGDFAWVPANDDFTAELSLFHSGEQLGKVRLNAITPEGDSAVVEVVLQPGQVRRFQVDALFPGLRNFALELVADVTLDAALQVRGRDLAGNGRPPALLNAVSRDEAGSELFFPLVPGDRVAALAIRAPFAAEDVVVDLSLIGENGKVGQTQVTLNRNRPQGLLMSDLFPNTTMPEGAVVQAQSQGQKLIGAQFSFNAEGHPAGSPALSKPNRLPLEHFKAIEADQSLGNYLESLALEPFVIDVFGAGLSVYHKDAVGTPLWTVRTPGPVWSASRTENQVVVVGEAQLSLYDFDEVNGLNLRESFDIAALDAEVVGNRLYYWYYDGFNYIDLETGALGETCRNFELESGLEVVYQGRFYTAANGALVVSSVNAQGQRESRIALDFDTLGLVNPYELRVSGNSLYIRNDGDQPEIWEFDLTDPLQPALVETRALPGAIDWVLDIADGYLLSSQGNQLRIYNLETLESGSFTAEVTFPAAVCSASLRDGWILVGIGCDYGAQPTYQLLQFQSPENITNHGRPGFGQHLQDYDVDTRGIALLRGGRIHLGRYQDGELTWAEPINAADADSVALHEDQVFTVEKDGDMSLVRVFNRETGVSDYTFLADLAGPKLWVEGGFLILYTSYDYEIYQLEENVGGPLIFRAGSDYPILGFRVRGSDIFLTQETGSPLWIQLASPQDPVVVELSGGFFNYHGKPGLLGDHLYVAGDLYLAGYDLNLPEQRAEIVAFRGGRRLPANDRGLAWLTTTRDAAGFGGEALGLIDGVGLQHIRLDQAGRPLVTGDIAGQNFRHLKAGGSHALIETSAGDIAAYVRLEPLAAALPWVTENASFRARIVIYNHQDQAVTVRLHAVDREGRASEVVREIAAKSSLSSWAGDLFPDMNGYTLKMFSSAEGLTLAEELYKIEDLRSPAQMAAGEPITMGNRLVFPHLSREDVSALVLTRLDENGGETPVSLYWSDEEGGTPTKTELRLQGNRPSATLLRDTAPEGEGPLALIVVAEEGVVLDGAVFIFDAYGRPAMSGPTRR